MTCKDCIHEKVCDALIKSGCPYLDEEVPADAFCMEFRNTADVVPKSEVEELKAIIVDHKANEERWQELYADTVDKWEKAYEELEIKLETIKTEVAREIFEEIERIFDGKKYVPYPLYEITELKKKYAENME